VERNKQYRALDGKISSFLEPPPARKENRREGEGKRRSSQRETGSRWRSYRGRGGGRKKNSVEELIGSLEQLVAMLRAPGGTRFSGKRVEGESLRGEIQKKPKEVY